MEVLRIFRKNNMVFGEQTWTAQNSFFNVFSKRDNYEGSW